MNSSSYSTGPDCGGGEMSEPTGEGEVQIVHPRYGEDHPTAAQAFGSPGAGGERVPKSPGRGRRQTEGMCVVDIV